MKDMPNIEFFSKYLEYNQNTGILTWKPRSIDLFKTRRAFSIWNRKFPGKEAGSVVKSGMQVRKNIVINKTFYQYHRVCMVMAGYSPEELRGKYIDHIDHNSLNNKISNLRLVDAIGNARNRSKNRNNLSGVSGVGRYPGGWYASIGSSENFEKYYFRDKFEAICKRKSLELKLNYHKNHGT